MKLGLMGLAGGVAFAALACSKAQEQRAGADKALEENRNAEARMNLGEIAKAMRAAFEEERMTSGTLAAGQSAEIKHELCGSTSKPVPESLADVDGKKYQSSVSEWKVDAARNAGFACLKFNLPSPQYFQYEVKSDPSRGEFTAYARRPVGGEILELSISGKVQSGVLNVAPSIGETRKPR